MHTLRLFPRLVWFEAQRFGAYPLEAAATIVERLIHTGLFILFWLLVGQFSERGDITPRAIVGYYLIVNGVVPFFYTTFDIAKNFILLIKNGELNQLLIRPVNVLVYPWASRTGRNALAYAFGLVFVVIGIIISQPAWTWHHALLFPFVVVNMLAINAAFNVMIGTLAFYFVEAKGFQSTAGHVSKILRGEFMPLHYMPPVVAGFLQMTPFPASAYHLSGLLQGSHPPSWQQVIVGGLWSIVLGVIAAWFWRRGLRRYEAIGL